MKRRLLLGITIVLMYQFNNGFAQLPTLGWAKQMGETSGSGIQEGFDITTDVNGNVYSTGYFTLTTDFDPGAGNLNITSSGGQDAYVSKLDANGNLIWAKKLGGASHELGQGVAVDAAGNVYVTGYFYGTGDFNPGAGIYNLTSTGNQDIFVVKLDAAGNFVWAIQYGNVNGEYPGKILVDQTGNVVITATFSGTIDLDPNGGISNVTSPSGNSVFVTKVSSTGTMIWGKIYNADQAADIALDPGNNILLGGYFSALTADFDPGPGVFNLNVSGPSDAYALKLDANGNFIWAKKLSGPGGDIVYGISSDAFGNVYLGGQYSDSSDFDPGIGIHRLVSFGGYDAFVCKLTAAGNFVWAHHMGGTDGERVWSLSTDVHGNVYTGGFYQANGDYDPGPGIQTLTFAGGVYDIFLTKLSTTGEHQWAFKIGETGFDELQSISVDNNGSIYATGEFAGMVDFNPGAGVFNLSSGALNDDDIYVFKLNQCSNGSVATVTSCNTYTLNAQTYTTSGTYTQHLTNHAGCDSVIVLNLTIKPNSSDTIEVTSCDSYIWYTNTYTSTGFYPHILTAHNGCDSTLILDLTILNSTAATQNITACNSYTWPVNGTTYNTSTNTSHTMANHLGCDSVITLNLTIHSNTSAIQNITACNTYTWPVNGITYNGSITTTHTIPNHLGCDSVITLNLTIHNSSSATQNITSCNTYTWPVNGMIYNSSATTTHTIPNHFGCDSVITLNLTIHNSTSAIQNMTACDTYTWPVNGITYNSSATTSHTIPNHLGCDSVITLNLIIHNSSSATQHITSCNTYTWPVNGVTYNSSATTSHTIPNHLGCDSVITLNLTIHNSSSATQNVTSCNTYTWSVNGITYNSSTNTTHTIPNHFGCDSVITLDLTIHNSTSATQNITACNTYTWPVNGITYNSSTNTTHTVPSHFGCDSVITLNLTIHNNSSATQNITACNTYTWPVNGTTYITSINTNATIPNHWGCDSVVTLELTIHNSSADIQNITACNLYTWPVNGITYTTSTNTTHTIPNHAGCDSVITLNLTINSANAGISQSGVILTADLADSYQWINCENGNTIPGATSQVFTASANGDYAVIITDHSCVDTSACVTVNNVSLEENVQLSVNLYPNPSESFAHLSFSQPINNATVKIITATGQVILNDKNVNGKLYNINMSEFAPAIYFVQIEFNHIVRTLPLIKK